MQSLVVFILIAASGTTCLAKSGKAARTSLTGCVDEREGEYVLTNDRDLQPTARLRPAAGSPEDNFARHIGEKVTVEGRLADGQPLPVLTVESLKTVSPTCAPQSEAQQK
ncbi:MAG TPA: hypothetical protein VMI94_01575 [Bryobacteraceae bacterium]|nr:hypothetical protein [Bryobacteraceae bacterium]